MVSTGSTRHHFLQSDDSGIIFWAAEIENADGRRVYGRLIIRPTGLRRIVHEFELDAKRERSYGRLQRLSYIQKFLLCPKRKRLQPQGFSSRMRS
jgi:hypothetical protein